MTLDDRYGRDALVAEIKAAGGQIKGSTVKCPFHADNNPSGQIYQADDGHWRFKCHSSECGFCGDIFDIRAKSTNRPLADILKEARGQSVRSAPKLQVFRTVEDIEATITGTLENRHSYTNPHTHKPDLIVLRIKENGKKRFLQISPQDNGFVLKAPPKPWPLYNRIELQKADRVIVVEGEKCVHALRGIRFVGTTSPAGAGKAEHCNWMPLSGKTVYLWPDNDIAGINHAKQVSQILDKLEPAPKVFWIDPAGLKLAAGGDVVDFLKRFKPELHHSAVESVLETAESVGASREVQALIEDTIAGRREAISWPWPVISKLTRALLPKTVTLICGDPGAAKSFFLLQALAVWFCRGIKSAVFELEEDRAYHLNRALVQQAEKSDLFDPDWIKANPEKVMSIFNEHKDFLDAFGRCIYAAPDKQVTLTDLVEWVEARASEKCRVIAVDPVTAAASQELTWVADSEFMFQIKAIAREYDVSVVLVTHPRKGRKGAVGLDELAGGAAFQRFSQTVIWLERHTKPKLVMVAFPVGRSNCSINWTAHLIKTRNGPGHGSGIGFNFCGKSLTFTEQGIIIPKEKN